jgi:hypothetical protein
MHTYASYYPIYIYPAQVMHPPEITDLQTLRMMKDVSQGMCALPAAAARPVPDRGGRRRALAPAHAGLSHRPTPGFR